MFKNLEKKEEEIKEENKEVVKDKEVDPEEDLVEGNWKIVDLPEVEIKTGLEDFDTVEVIRVKSYRCVDNQWKERGIGEFKFLKHKTTGYTYGIHVQEQIFKTRLNFIILGKNLCKLELLGKQEKTWVFACIDYSEGKQELSRFCVRFNKEEEWKKFQEVFENAYKVNTELKAKEEETKGEETKGEETKGEEKKEEENKEEEKKE